MRFENKLHVDNSEESIISKHKTNRLFIQPMKENAITRLLPTSFY